jgi:hypothetical protein
MPDIVTCVQREGVSGACRSPDQSITPALVRLLRRSRRAREIRVRRRIPTARTTARYGSAQRVRRGSASIRVARGTCRWGVSPTARCATRRAACTTRSSRWSWARAGVIASTRLRPARKPSDGSPPNSASSRCQDRSTTFHSNSASRQSGMSKHSSRIAAPHRLGIGLKQA